MNIVVCMKQVLDPEVPTREFRVDPARKEAVRGSANLVTDLFCENALETALQLRERAGGRITALAFGPPSAEETLRKALAIRADAGVLVVNNGKAHPDPFRVAAVLAAAIRRIASVDLVLTGRESADWGSGQTGALLAEELDLPCVSFVDQIEIIADGMRARRQTDAGWEIFQVATPAVLTITNNEHNVPRIPKTRDIMASGRQPLTRWSLADLAVVEELQPYFEVVDLFVPKRETQCHFAAGDTLEQKVDEFTRRVMNAARSA